MKTNEKFLSFYYRNMKEVPDIHLNLAKTALLIVDMQKHFLLKDGEDAEGHKKSGTWEKWKPYFDHVEKVTIPNNKRLIDACRKHGIAKAHLDLDCAQFRKPSRNGQLDLF